MRAVISTHPITDNHPCLRYDAFFFFFFLCRALSVAARGRRRAESYASALLLDADDAYFDY